MSPAELKEAQQPAKPAAWTCICGFTGKKMRGLMPRPSTKSAKWCPACLEQC